MSMLLEILCGSFILIGTLFIFLSAIGLLKMPDLYMRTSVTTKSATLGVGMVLFGTAFFFGSVEVYARAILIIIFVYMTAPVASHMIARASFLDNVPIWSGTKVNHLEGKYCLKDKHLRNGNDDDCPKSE